MAACKYCGKELEVGKRVTIELTMELGDFNKNGRWATKSKTAKLCRTCAKAIGEVVGVDVSEWPSV